MNTAVKVYLLAITLYLVSVVRATSYTVTVVNNVAPCSGGSYSTISLFISPSQKIMKQGDTVVVPSANISSYVGLGIQENGEYCRFNGSQSGCYNPDNAGMQLWVNNNNCEDISLNDPFYCGTYPPNAKKIVSVAMSGTFPNCVATLTRLSTAPNCQYSCPVGVTNNTGAASSSSSSSSSSTSGSSTPSPTPSTVGFPKYIGCYIDQQWNRDLPHQVLTSSANTMTVEACEAACLSAGYAYAALQYASQCFCGTTYGTKGGVAPSTDCNMPCKGNSAEICGAGLRNSIYQVQSSSTAANDVSEQSPNSSSSLSLSFVVCFALLFCSLYV